MPLKSKIGRPLKFSSARQLEKKVQEYFDQCEEKPTVTGLANYLGLSRRQLIEYQGREEYNNVIKGARSMIEERVEQQLLYGKQSPAGLIFWLKNQGWSDTQEINFNDITKLTKEELVEKIKQMADKSIPMPKRKAVNE